MKRFFTSFAFVLLATIWVHAQATYTDFAVQNCTGGVSTEQFHEGTQSYKTLGGGVSNPQLTVTINNIPDWTTITKVSLWMYTTASWNNGQVAINASVPGWKSQTFSATSNTWTNLVWDFSATPFDAANTWGQFIVQYYNTSADLFYDQITFYNAAGDVVYQIDASDVSAPPTGIVLKPSDNTVIVGKSLPLVVTVEPVSAGSACDFISSDPAVATVDAFGIVTTLSAGTTTITATSKLDAMVSNTATVNVTDPDASNSVVFANFENGLGNYDAAWASWIGGGPGPMPTVEIVDNPAISMDGNPTAKALKVSNLRQYGAVAFKAFDVNKINTIKFKVYSETAISDLSFELGLDQGASSTAYTSATALPAATWTEYTFNVGTMQAADRKFYIKLSSAGSATAAYTLYIDDVEMLAGTGFVPVASFTIDGAGAVSTIDADNGTLQMEASDFLPVDATNQSVSWAITSTNVPEIASITSDGLLTAVRNGTVTVRGTADVEGVFAEKEITLSNQNLDFSDVTAVAKKLDAPHVSSADDFSVNVDLSYDADSIYMVFNVKDDSIVNVGTAYLVDNIEVYFDMTNSKNPLWPRGAGWPNSSFVAGDYQLRLVPGVAWSVNNTLKGVNQVYTRVEGGYQFILNIPLDSLSKDFMPAPGTLIGFDVLASDNDMQPDYRDQLSWNSNSVNLWNDPSYWGTIEFADGGSFYVIEDKENPTAPTNVVATTTARTATITWDAASDNNVVQDYIVKSGTTVVDTVFALETGNKYTFTNLKVGMQSFSVITEDVSLNKSTESFSNEVNVVVWSDFSVAKKLDAPNVSSATDFTTGVKVRWDVDSIYMVFNVKDDSIVNTGTAYLVDNIEIYFDMANSKNPLWPREAGWPNTSFVAGDYQLRLVPDVAWSVNNSLKGVNQVYTKVTGGYQFMVNIPIDSLSKDFVASIGKEIGFDILASDNDMQPDYRDQVSWNSSSAMLWNDPSYWGTIQFAADGLFATVADIAAPSVPANVVAVANVKNAVLTWDASTDNIVVQNYIVMEGTTVLDTILAKTTANTYTVTGLADGNYTFSVVAMDLYNNKSAKGVSNAIDIATGIQKLEASMTFSPNPVNDILNINCSQNISKVSIYNITGKLLNSVNVNDVKTVINFNDYANGVYFVKVQTTSGVKTQKIVKE